MRRPPWPSTPTPSGPTGWPCWPTTPRETSEKAWPGTSACGPCCRRTWGWSRRPRPGRSRRPSWLRRPPPRCFPAPWNARGRLRGQTMPPSSAAGPSCAAWRPWPGRPAIRRWPSSWSKGRTGWARPGCWTSWRPACRGWAWAVATARSSSATCPTSPWPRLCARRSAPRPSPTPACPPWRRCSPSLAPARPAPLRRRRRHSSRSSGCGGPMPPSSCSSMTSTGPIRPPWRPWPTCTGAPPSSPVR